MMWILKVSIADSQFDKKCPQEIIEYNNFAECMIYLFVEQCTRACNYIIILNSVEAHTGTQHKIL